MRVLFALLCLAGLVLATARPEPLHSNEQARIQKLVQDKATSTSSSQYKNTEVGGSK